MDTEPLEGSFEEGFGDAVTPAEDPSAGDWIAPARRTPWGTVGSLVPNGFDLVARVAAPPEDAEDWWGDYQELFALVASVADRHTSTPERAWFAIWDGYGFDTRVTLADWDPAEGVPDDTIVTDVALRVADEHRNARVRNSLGSLVRLELPHRDYFLLSGPVSAAVAIAEPGSTGEWLRPDLWWPDDRRWFVATDVDLQSLYIGGDESFVVELTRQTPTEPELVTWDDLLADAG